MTREQFILHLNSLSDNDKVDFLKQFAKKSSDIQTYLNQYDPLKHDVFSQIKRPDKQVRKPVMGFYNADGSQLMQNYVETVARIAVDAQQDITKNASGILCANKIELENAEKIEDVWNANRLDLATIRLCNIWLSETEVAELWYRTESEIKYLSLSNGQGDTLCPVFDDFGKMICFGRAYKSSEIIGNELSEVEVFEIYLETTVQRGQDDANGNFIFSAPVNHGFPKIPVSYCTRDLPIWSNVQTSIDQGEKTISNICDTNAYHASPTVVVNGKIDSYASKGEQGKIIEIGETAKINYLTWNQAPESIKFELEQLDKIIFNSTRTVRLTIENLKGLFGSAPSAYAIKLLFTPAHLQAAEHEEIFGEYIQRRLNIIGSVVGVEADRVKPKFTYYLPNNDTEQLSNIVSAVNNGLLSEETGIRQNPLVVDADNEIDLIDAEKKVVSVIKPTNGVPINI